MAVINTFHIILWRKGTHEHMNTHTHTDLSVAVMEVWLGFECNSGENLCSHK